MGKLKYPVPPKTITEIEAVTNSIPQVDTQICLEVQHSWGKERKAFELTSTGHVYDHVDVDVHGG